MNMQICFVLFGQHSQQGHFSNQNTKNTYYIKEAKVKNLSLSYSYSELLSCNWMLKQKRIFYSHTCVNVSPLNHTIITLTCRQAHHSSCPLSLHPLSAHHFLCPALSPLAQLSLRLAPSPLRSASPHCGSVIVDHGSVMMDCGSVMVVHGVSIYRLQAVVMYCVGIYYFIVLFTTFDVRCIIK